MPAYFMGVLGTTELLSSFGTEATEEHRAVDMDL